MLRPAQVRWSLDVAFEQLQTGVELYWLPIAGDRGQFQDDLTVQCGGLPVVTLVVRGQLFLNANSVFDDFVDLLEANKHLVTPTLAEIIRREKRCMFVLLSRTPLEVAQLSSPVSFPEWFPCFGGNQVSTVIRDLVSRPDASVAECVSGSGSLPEAIHLLEIALIARLQDVHQRDPTLSNHLLELLRRKGEVISYGDLLLAAKKENEAVVNRQQFRPSTSPKSQSLVGRLWFITSTTPPDSLPSPAKALAAALNLSGLTFDRPHDSLPFLLARPSTQIADSGVRAALNLLTTIRAACQLTTAAAHADAYDRYPAAFLSLAVDDLVSTLSGLTEGLGGD